MNLISIPISIQMQHTIRKFNLCHFNFNSFACLHLAISLLCSCYLEIIEIYAGCIIGPCFICFRMSKPIAICVAVFVCKTLMRTEKGRVN